MGRIGHFTLALGLLVGAVGAQPEADFTVPEMERPGIYIYASTPESQAIHMLWGTNFQASAQMRGRQESRSMMGDIILFIYAETEEQLAEMQGGMEARRVDFVTTPGTTETRTQPIELAPYLAPQMASGSHTRAWDFRGAEHDIQVMIRTHDGQTTHVAKTITFQSAAAAERQRGPEVSRAPSPLGDDFDAPAEAASRSWPIPETSGVHLYHPDTGAMERIMPWPAERAEEGWPSHGQAVDVPPGTLLVVRTSEDPSALSDLMEHVTAWSEEPLPDRGGAPGTLRRPVQLHSLRHPHAVLTSDTLAVAYDPRGAPGDLVVSFEWGEDGTRMMRTYTFPAAAPEEVE